VDETTSADLDQNPMPILPQTKDKAGEPSTQVWGSFAKRSSPQVFNVPADLPFLFCFLGFFFTPNQHRIFYLITLFYL
jgi:hypothetical protein